MGSGVAANERVEIKGRGQGSTGVVGNGVVNQWVSTRTDSVRSFRPSSPLHVSHEGPSVFPQAKQDALILMAFSWRREWGGGGVIY